MGEQTHGGVARVAALYVQAGGCYWNLPGLASPAETPADPDLAPLSREAFEAKMAEYIADDEETHGDKAAELAKTVLDAYLADNGIEYGAPDASWTAAEALQLVDDATQAQASAGT